jgi:thiamine pyrophosphokinase
MDGIINRHKSVIFLSGCLPCESVVSKINLNVVKVSADGAGIHLHPDYIVGDMDSVSLKCPDSTHIKISDQSTTDFEKCLSFIENRSLCPTLVLGISGGEIDHVINNIMVLVNYNFPIYFLHQVTIKKTLQIGLVVTNYVDLKLCVNSVVSILPFSTALVSTAGLKWNLNNAALRHDGLRGPRNFSVDPRVQINVHRGRILLVVNIEGF